jgi:NAD(P)-dependent dehydrogenase (short-subunit alcohol dehydrogenase family)
VIRQVAVVTGASSGIGKAAAVALARRGFAIGIGYCRDARGAQQTAESVQATGADWHLFALDQSQPESAADAVTAAIDALGGVGVFVNSAGVNRRSSVLEENLGDWDRILTTDLTGPFACAQAAARRMTSAGAGGRIVNVTSVHEHVPIRGGAAYCAAKAGLGLLTKVMALELAPYGITVNAVSPGETATPMNGVADIDNVDVARLARPGIPTGRPGRAAEVASLIAYLAGDDAGYLTGASLLVDGGLSLMAAIPNQDSAQGSAAYHDSSPTRPSVPTPQGSTP